MGALNIRECLASVEHATGDQPLGYTNAFADSKHTFVDYKITASLRAGKLSKLAAP